MKVYIIHKELVADGMAEINETRAFDSKEKAAKVFNEIKEKEIKEETLNKLALDRATFIYSL